MKWILVFLCMASLAAAQTPEEGLKRLQAGNKRFVDEALLHPDRTHERRSSLVEGQSPYAVIVTCSDSRVVPEVIFDEGLGDLFVIRVAGNIVGPTELESVLYAVNHLNPVIAVVMGHESCGAVEAVVEGQTEGIPAIAALVKPSVEKAKRLKPKDLLMSSIKLNALKMRALLLKSSAISKQVEEKSLAIHSAYYNLQTGAVEFLHPNNVK